MPWHLVAPRRTVLHREAATGDELVVDLYGGLGFEIRCEEPKSGLGFFFSQFECIIAFDFDFVNQVCWKVAERNTVNNK